MSNIVERLESYTLFSRPVLIALEAAKCIKDLRKDVSVAKETCGRMMVEYAELREAEAAAMALVMAHEGRIDKLTVICEEYSNTQVRMYGELAAMTKERDHWREANRNSLAGGDAAIAIERKKVAELRTELADGLERMFRVIASDHPTHVKRWTSLELDWINERITLAILAEREACANHTDAV